MPAPVVLTYLGSAVTALGKIGEYLAAPIGRQFTYMCCFNRNITELEIRWAKLQTAREEVQMGVDATHRTARVIGPIVVAWLNEADEVTRDCLEIIKEKARVNQGCLKRWCPNPILRYSLSRKAVKKTKVIKDLLDEFDECIQLTRGYNPPPVCMEVIPNEDFTEFESRRLIMEEIVMALMHDEINLIGICGLPGVGKTKMVQEVRKRAKEEKLSDEVAFADVGQYPDLRKLQKCIGESLGVVDIGRFDDASTRAGLLRQRLVQDKKKILLILDDVWEELDLQYMGIPLGDSNKNFKMLYTSRMQQLWNNVQTKKEISLELLLEDEAWQLFKEKAGNLVDDPNLQPIAKQIVDQCGRLPLALVIIGSTLSKKRRRNSTMDIWEEMLHRLNCQSGTPADKRLLLSLEMSYNYVADEQAKSLFLLCCLFEEDKYISVEDLARYVWGLSLFRGLHELGKVRRRVIFLVEYLSSCHLLLDHDIDGQVKLHDVMRDMGISIASRDNKRSLVSHGNMSEWPMEDTYEDYTYISVISQKTIGFREGLRCPNLQFLLLRCKNLDEMPCNFFDGIKKLRALVLIGYSVGPPRYLRNCSLALQSLRYLRTLCFENLNATLDNVSAIGDLKDLEILSMGGCSIDELPTEIGKLAKLRLLDLTNCRLCRIPPGVISRLVGLEELYMMDCGFVDWEREGNEKGINASLREFESLSKLHTLEVKVLDAALCPQIPIFSKLTKFLIEIEHPFRCVDWRFKRPKPKYLSVSSSSPIRSDYGGLNSLLKITECLALQGEGTSDLVRELLVMEHYRLKNLLIGLCTTPKCLGANVFHGLETLHLYKLTNLRDLCWGPASEHTFWKLTSLIIEECVAVEEVIRSDKNAHLETKMMKFPELESLELRGLPSLVGFYGGADKIHFPKLKELLVEDVGFLSLFSQEVSLPNLEKLELINLQNFETLGHGPLSLGSLSKLKQIYVRHCEKLLCVFPSMLQDFHKLTIELEGVDASDRGEDADIVTKTIEFPKLESLELRGLPNLVNFCGEVDKIRFPELKKLEVEDVGFLALFPQEVSLPKLETLELINLQNLETLGHGPLSFGSSSKLKEIHVRLCRKLRGVFPSELLPMQQDLQKLTVELEGVDASEPNTDILSPVDITLSSLPKLNYISKRDPMVFKYIHSLYIFKCDGLIYVFAPTMTKSIPQLRELKISSCEVLSRIVAKENGLGESSVDEVEFPHLERLKLQNLPNLVSFFPKVTTTRQHLFNEKVAIPSLKYLEIQQLKNLSDLGFNELPTSSFSELKELKVIDCENLRNTFHPSVVEAFANLEKLVIRNCSKMDAVVDSEEEGQERKIDKAMFPQLRKVELDSLYKLRMFCHFTCPLELPLLSQMEIRDCPFMDAFSLGDLSFPKLCLLGTSSKDILNHARRFAEEQDQLEEEGAEGDRVGEREEVSGIVEEEAGGDESERTRRIKGKGVLEA